MTVLSYQYMYKPMHVLQCDITCPSPCEHIIILGLPKKVWLIYVYINYNARSNACTGIKNFSCHYVAIDTYSYQNGARTILMTIK